MTKSLYVASVEGRVGKSAIALGLIESLTRQVESIGVFRPLVKDVEDDVVLRTLVGMPMIDQSYEDAVGVSYERLGQDADAAMEAIVAKFGAIRDRYDAVVIVGSDYSDVQSPTEMAFNAEVAANLNAPVIIAINGRRKSPTEVRRSARVALQEFENHHTDVIAIIANRCEPDQRDEAAAELASLEGNYVTAAMPDDPVLGAPTVRAQFEALDARLWLGDPKMLDRESLGVLVSSMTLPNLLDRLEPEFSLVAPSDRLDLLPGLTMAHRSGTFPNLAAIFLVGGYPIPDTVTRLLKGIQCELPIGLVQQGTFRTAEKLFGMEGTMTSSPRKVEVARRLFNQYVDDEAILAAMHLERAEIRTPVMFEYQIMQQARANKRTIVLPEASDPRILESASIILQRGVANIVLLGDPTEVKRQSHAQGFDIDGAVVVDPTNPDLAERFAEEYARLRAHKGMTIEKAREVLTDLSYFATMMVHLGMADGMVSGAINTTANTIRPSLEFIKTKPGVKIVSSSFLMCMPDRVLVYADCAVNPDPTDEQLADIAVVSSETARQFGIDPRVAMLSYSTGTSGSGADVDKVRSATEQVRTLAPELKVEGPIQFDAAVDPKVGSSKMPGSEVAGQATVFIFPDLNTGNNTYKAVQRTSGAVAVGPVLQGLNKPVNDLSRGALVDDIVNTVAITAIQAQADDTPADVDALRALVAPPPLPEPTPARDLQPSPERDIPSASPLPTEESD
ncbi:phosphate acetyltransferase [Aestuariimicrobium ganziense]|uniref:phosphate acetyltransferase n=1 Tax=Aestuariimicrobium ganziense TaxID=2773677 RepID=UPI0019413B7F|nr:phosphate acetyltransferase [Aestuariimicrobium ganziense]